MRRTLRFTIIGFAAWASLQALPALAQGTKVSIGYATATDFLAVFVAKDKGFFDKRGIDATPTRMQIATNIPAAIVSGSLQIGMTTVPILLQAADGGLDLVVVAGASRMVKANPTISLVARKEVKIAGAADLKGKKVGVAGINSVTDVFLKKWLLNNKVDLKDVTIIEAPIPQMADLLKAGTLDAVTAVEPVRTRIVAGDIGYVAAEYFSDVSPDVLVTAWIATGDWARKNPAVVKGFREAIDEGLAFIKSNPDEAKEIEKKYLGFNSPRFPTFANVVKPEDLVVFADVGKELGLLRKPVDTAKLVLK
jgi:NitT/TauT family transport system substrate-binding protein